MSDSGEPVGEPNPAAHSPGRRLAVNLTLYTLARLGVVVGIAVVIIVGGQLVSVDIPLLAAALFAVIIAMPLSLTLFKGLRAKVNADIATMDEQRRKDKAALRARLRGDTDQSDTDAPDGPDAAA